MSRDGSTAPALEVLHGEPLRCSRLLSSTFTRDGWTRALTTPASSARERLPHLPRHPLQRIKFFEGSHQRLGFTLNLTDGPRTNQTSLLAEPNRHLSKPRGPLRHSGDSPTGLPFYLEPRTRHEPDRPVLARPDQLFHHPHEYLARAAVRVSNPLSLSARCRRSNWEGRYGVIQRCLPYCSGRYLSQNGISSSMSVDGPPSPAAGGPAGSPPP